MWRVLGGYGCRGYWGVVFRGVRSVYLFFDSRVVSRRGAVFRFLFVFVEEMGVIYVFFKLGFLEKGIENVFKRKFLKRFNSRWFR